MSNTMKTQPLKADSTPKEVEARIRQIADKNEGLTFGYIGNFERWGDDRLLYLWVKGVNHEGGNQAHIWSAEAKSLTRSDYSQAAKAIRLFDLGWQAAKMQTGLITCAPPTQ